MFSSKNYFLISSSILVYEGQLSHQLIVLEYLDKRTLVAGDHGDQERPSPDNSVKAAGRVVAAIAVYEAALLGLLSRGLEIGVGR